MMRTVLIITAVVLLAAAGCSSSDDVALPTGADPVEIDPATFTSTVDNPWFPLRPGSEWVYEETDSEGTVTRVVVTVTDETREVMGIEAVVVHDVVSENGAVIEDTYDWYAQDADGNVWYLGEDTKELEDGVVTSTTGSWEAGIDGAQPGILVPAEPEVGLEYRQEYLEGEAEDGARVIALDATASVPYGSFDGLLETEDFTPLHPELLEHKYYARGVGPVLAETVRGGSDREELVSYTRGR